MGLALRGVPRFAPGGEEQRRLSGPPIPRVSSPVRDDLQGTRRGRETSEPLGPCERRARGFLQLQRNLHRPASRLAGPARAPGPSRPGAGDAPASREDREHAGAGDRVAGTRGSKIAAIAPPSRKPMPGIALAERLEQRQHPGLVGGAGQLLDRGHQRDPLDAVAERRRGPRRRRRRAGWARSTVAR